MRNQGLLLSGALAYYTLLSIVPMTILFLTGLSHFIETLEKRQLILFGWSVSLAATSRTALHILGITSEVALLSSIYLLMPAVRTTLRHALIGALTATILWEIFRHVLVWYYSTLSLVNLIYGSFATAVVTLLITEAAAIILLLGAQVIAELERKTNEMTEEKPSGFET
jgi:membrane protein